MGSYEHSNGPFLGNTGNSQTNRRPVSFSGRICSMELVLHFHHRSVILLDVGWMDRFFFPFPHLHQGEVALSQGLKQLDHETDHSPSHSTVV